MTRYTPTERIGVSAIESITARELGWIFREQPIADMGIDAQIELVEDGFPSGKLIGIQIKTGAGNFRLGKDGLVYYGSSQHLEYWSGHSLPVIIVAHLPDTNETFWQIVNSKNVKKTSKAWKISIPRGNVFGSATKRKLTEVFEGSSAQQRMRKLTLEEPLMRHIAKGGKVCLELEEWINKSLGRSPVCLVMVNDDGVDEIQQDYHICYTGYSVEGLAKSLFPWCEVHVDEEYYEYHEERESYSIWDDDGYYSSTRKIYPYGESAGEVQYYRLQLSLSELGESFLKVADFLNKSPDRSLFDK